MIREFFLDGPMLFMICCELILISVFSRKDQDQGGRSIPGSLAAALGLVLLVMILDFYFVDFDTASTVLEAVFCFLASFFYAWMVLKHHRKEAFYDTVWCYLLTETAAQIVMPLTEVVLRGRKEPAFYILYVVCCAAGIFLPVFLVRKFLLPKLRTEKQGHIGGQKILYCIVVAGGYFLFSNYQFIFWLLGGEPEKGSNMITIFRLVVGIACILFLYIQNNIENMQKTEQELNMMQQLMYRQHEQYQISQENIDLINRKCHDLRHQMEALRKLKDEKEIDEQLKELEHSAMIYDSIIKTGNPVLDTVLTEKSLICEARQIHMTCMADGAKLDFVGKVDLYTMFGNALDNAIECVMKQEDINKRVIQVAVFYEKNLLMIRVRNYCEERLKFKNDLPVSTKKDKNYHGFGLKSIQYTAEKYGGEVVCQNPENYFVLQILLPVPGDI